MKISIFHASAGHGHKKVAQVLCDALKRQAPSEADCEVFDALDFTPPVFRSTYPALYYNSVKHAPALWGWAYETADRPLVYRFLRPLRSLANRVNGRGILEKVHAENPAVVVSTHFFTAELLASAKMRGEIRTHLITVITDFYPHTFWVNPGTDLYWVMSSEGAEELLRRGVDPVRIRAAGIPVDPAFKPQGAKESLLKRWDFSRERFTVLMTSGSFGLGPQEELLKALRPYGKRLQCFVVCGNNSALEARLKALDFGFPVRVFGFVDFMPDLMEASDLLVAKSGGSTTTEALSKELPMVVMEPIPGQESRNARLLGDRHAAFFIKSPGQIATIMKVIFDQPGILEAKRSEIRMLARPDAAAELARYVLDQAKGGRS